MISGKHESIAVQAQSDLSGNQYRVTDVGGTLAESSAVSVGILQTKPNSGQQGTIGYFGHMKGYAGAAVNSATSLKVASGGFLIAVASGDGPGVVVGRALIGANSGDLFEGLFNFINANATPVASS